MCLCSGFGFAPCYLFCHDTMKLGMGVAGGRRGEQREVWRFGGLEHILLSSTPASALMQHSVPPSLCTGGGGRGRGKIITIFHCTMSVLVIRACKGLSGAATLREARRRVESEPLEWMTCI